MATIHNLARALGFETLVTELDHDEFEERTLYATADVLAWLANDFAAVEQTYDAELSPEEQLETLVHRFITGAVLEYWYDLHILRESVNGVWELKTNDLRFFGWFPTYNCFVICKIEPMVRCKEFPALVNAIRNEVIRFRDGLDLDEPRFVAGDELRHVISN